MKRKLCMLLASVLCIGMLAGCGSEEKKEQGVNDEKKVIVLGSSPTAAKVIESAVPELEKKGYKVDIKVFDDYVLPNTALMEGSIDGNIFQHQPYLDEFNKNNNSDLIMADKLVLDEIGIYSQKIKDMNSIPDNAIVGIFQDASNQDRALRTLAEFNLIKLKDKKDGLYSILDIEENPKNLEFKTMDINQLIKNIDDLDIVFVPSSHVARSGVQPKYQLAIESVNDNSMKYAEGLVIRKEDKDKQWVKDVLDAYRSEDTKKRQLDTFKGNYGVVIDYGK